MTNTSNMPSGWSRRSILKGGAALGAAGLALPFAGKAFAQDNTLSFWQFYAPGGDVKPQVDWFVKMVADWNATQAEQVALEYVVGSEYIGGTKLATSFASGQGPDIFIISPEVPFWRYLINTFVISAVVTVVALFFHTMAGYALARLRFPGREVVFLAMFSTFLVSLPVIIVPLFILVRSMGMLNSYAGLIVPAIFNAFGIFLLRQYYLSLPKELEEAAVIDGAGYWRIYWSVILPLSRPIIAALAILFFLANWNSFLWPLTVASDQNLWVVQVAIANFKSQYAASWNYTMAASTIVAMPMLVLFVIFQRQIMDSIKTSGLKG